MGNKILEHSLRKIKNNYKRFMSLLCIAFLGVGFYSSIQITAPEMVATLDTYYDNQNVYDIKILSTLGLTNKDIEEINKIDGIEETVGLYSEDVYIDFEEEQLVSKIYAYNDKVNDLIVLEGDLPQNINECVVEKDLINTKGLKIGDTIKIKEDDFEENNNFTTNEFKIVGIIQSPLYILRDRGTTSLGSGSIDYYMYVNEKNIKSDIYTEIAVKVNNAKEQITNSEEYNNLINNVISKIELIAEEKLNDAREEINEIEKAKWYIMDRMDNSGYSEVIGASKSISSIGKVFPLIFYIIAIFIALISMMRMVEEDRVENGTLKALGYTSISITMKYIIYSLLATVIGGLLGIIVLNTLIPRIIWTAYQGMMFNVPGFTSVFSISSCMIGLIAGIICICGCSIFVSYKNLRDKPSNLMRPKAPKVGKRVFLENINFIWKRIKFSDKITIRNIFRYKSRVLATIVGIAGCTALTLTGLGLRDSVQGIVINQYNNVFHYDKIITLSNYSETFINELDKYKEIENITSVYMGTITLENANREKEIKLIIPDNEEIFDKAISLRDINNSYNTVKLEDDEICITKKVASYLGIKAGDNLNIQLENDKTYSVKVKAIIENYIGQYTYLNKSTYEKIFEKYETNVLLINTNLINESEEKEFDKKIIENEDVTSIITSNDTIEFLNNMIDGLDTIIIIFIIVAALLAFVVLYNLSNINISERKREIATLKVLGFYHKEVDNYITKETVIFTIIGVILGLILGKFLSSYLMYSCETDDLVFSRIIDLLSYVLAGIMTIIFTIVTNIFTHFNLKKIDMIESLKNVE